ncbi:uncharacterized protein BDV17DRAFT_275017 [Aspergillus undulatus]|uniref:uncharacterized protein n=1 Tax=Aspergillus undulatus TaxID=1810928 RepID=UPI003CCE4B13
MEDIRPTAKWANRMLRPLTSIYHRLEKHHEIVTSVLISKTREKEKQKEADTAFDDEQRTRPLLTKKGAEQGCSYSDDEEPNDPAWIPGVGKTIDKRRIRHNYSTRGRGAALGARKRSRLLIRSPEAPKTLPGAIEIATPLITGKIRGGGSLTEASPSLRMQLFQNNLSGGLDGGIGGLMEQRKAGRTNKSSFQPYQGSWKEVLDQSGDQGLVDIAHLLDRIFLKFLRSTRVTSSSGQDDGGQRGARSLLSMAMRRLPEFIAEEQRIQDEFEEGCDVDMCDAYFTELEASYAPGGNGWQPLREAVRAQGIYLVSCMIENRWITSLAACRLLEECLSQHELDAFETLQTKVLESVSAYHYPTTFDPPRPSGHRDDPIQILGGHYRRHPTQYSYVFEELTRLLSCGAMPSEWMVTTLWKKCVDKAIKLVSTEDNGYPAARRLIEAVVLSSAGIYPGSGPRVLPLKGKRNQAPRPARPRETRASTNTAELLTGQTSCPIPIQDALSNLVSSLLTALCGICIARSQATGADERSAGLRTREMVNTLAFTVQRAIGVESAILDAEHLALHQLRRGYVLLADCTLQFGKSVTPEIIYHSEFLLKQNIEAFFRELSTRQDVVRELARLVSQVFHYSGHTQDRGPVRTPVEIRARVSQLAQMTSTPRVTCLLGKVAAEAAMELAEKSLDPDDHTWAVEIQETAASSQQRESSDQSPSSSQVHASLYRWEDSIGEWVTRTPAARPPALAAAIAAKPQARPSVRRRGRPRIIACSTSSSSASSICSEKSVSSVTSSAPSVSRKRPCSNQPSSPQPFKKAYHTRSVERLVSNASDWINAHERSPGESSPGATHVPVAARTRAGLRNVLRRQSVGQERSSAPARAANITVGPTSTNTIEVVIINKSPSTELTQSDHAAMSTDPRPIRRRNRARYSSVIPRKSPRIVRRRQSAPARVTRRSLRATIPCSQDDDSDDELSFL